MSIFLFSCEKDSDDPMDTEFSPSVRCIINSTDVQTNLIEIVPGNNVFQINANFGDSQMTLQMQNPPSEGSYPLDGTTNDQIVYSDNFNNVEYISDDGSITISRYDEATNELEGTFQFHGIEFFGAGEINVIDGQFSAIMP
ncbi:MAG: hypothetical protein HKN39_01450 [Flavobacteriales bacterium]|nr:hypothetical protein [Flavobacteriales bacterium]